MTVQIDVIIVGAGPYGLSVAAHLRKQNTSFRIIGSPMHNWIAKMPKGMLLKSPGFASNLHDPGRTFTFRQFCKEQGVPYQDVDLPISLETFCAYGIAFQKQFAPELEDDILVELRHRNGHFELRMESGKTLVARAVVLAVGIDYFRRIPRQLSNLPPQLVSHSGDHQDLQKFQGHDVAVLGSGASAIDIAVLLHEANASVQHIVRKNRIHFGAPWLDKPRTLWRRIREPISGIGPGWRSRLYADLPWLYRYLPDKFRLRTARTHLGPSGGWVMKDRAASVPALLGYHLAGAAASGNRVTLYLVHSDGSRRDVSADHVISATGYDVNIQRLPFLQGDIINDVQHLDGNPRLSAHFESSIPGLYFIGPVAAASFGPLMRFVAGTEFTSDRLARHLAQRPAMKKKPATRLPKVETES